MNMSNNYDDLSYDLLARREARANGIDFDDPDSMYLPDGNWRTNLRMSDQLVCIAVCEVGKMTPETWQKLSLDEKVPWIERAIEADKIRMAPPSDQPSATKLGNQKKNVNGRMMDKILKDPECRGWTAKEWAECLKCSAPSVVTTRAWKELAQFRQEMKAERARDRHGRGAGRTET
jgi:hypothetical protein